MERKIKVDGLFLKWVAIATMFLDHFALVFIRHWAENYEGASILNFGNKAQIIYNLCRLIGRLAFPIFAFLLVEGIKHTSNKLRYAFRLLLFGLISEVPFDLVVRNTWFYRDKNNVMWTLLIGFLAMWAIEYIREKITNQHLLRLGIGLVALAAMILAFVIHSDYSATGVAAILIMYMFSEYRGEGFALAVAILCIGSKTELAALLAFPFIYLYDGSRGKINRKLQCFFYVFYPAHLLLIGLVARALGI